MLTICNVCTLNLRQGNQKLQEDPKLLARVNDNLKKVGAATYDGGIDVRHLLWRSPRARATSASSRSP